MPRFANRKKSRPQQGRRADAVPSPRYFTDGTHLYRFVEWLARSETSAVAILEDCRSLAILLVTAERLGAAELRPV
jgi:hypothetical protein